MKRSKVLLLKKIKQKDKDFTFLLNLAISELGLHLSIYPSTSWFERRLQLLSRFGSSIG